MKRTLIQHLPTAIGPKVKVCGWLHSIRLLKQIAFLIVRDHSGLIQVTIQKDVDSLLFKKITNLTKESTLEIIGRIVNNQHVKMGGIEIIPEEINIISLAESILPADNNSEPSIKLDWRYLDLRNPKNLLIFQIQTSVEKAMRVFWAQNGFIEIHSPKLMGSPSESGAELFEVKYFEDKAYLAQSPQFYKQMAMAAGFDRVFEIGPVFRANPSFTSRHDTEFTSVDVEMSWVESHHDIIKFEEEWLYYILSRIKENHGEEIEKIFGTKIIIPSLPFPKIEMSEAYSILSSLNHSIPAEYAGDLDPEGEKLLCNYVHEKYNHEFVFITDYPISVRPFYHMRYDDNPKITKSFDLLWKGLEVTTGAQREHRIEILKNQAIEKGLSLSSIQFYLDFFRFGIPTHGGFGFGLTRMLMIMLGCKNVREVTYIYRGPKRLFP